MENTAWGGTGATSPAPSHPLRLAIFSRQAGKILLQNQKEKIVSFCSLEPGRAPQDPGVEQPRAGAAPRA